MGSILRCAHPVTEGVAGHACIVAIKGKRMGFIHTSCIHHVILLKALLHFLMNLIH